MNFLLITTEYPPQIGGVANYYENLINYCPSEHKIMVLDNNKQKIVNNLMFFSWLPTLFSLLKIIKFNKIDHILVGQILPLGLPAIIIFFIFKIKYSVILHGMDFTFGIKKKRKKLLTKYLLNYADKIICSNSYLQKIISDFIGKSDKIFTINPGVMPGVISANEISHNFKYKYKLHDKIVLLTVGRLVKRKGIDRVIESLPKVLKQIPNLAYVIVGNGKELSNYKLQITNYKLNKNIILIENANNDERNAWYDICDIFIMPSRKINDDFEGFGIVYLEANLAGKPVIAGNSGGIGDAVIDNLNGLLINPENVDEISQAIIKLSDDKNLRDKLGKIGQNRAINEFGWAKQATMFFNLYK